MVFVGRSRVAHGLESGVRGIKVDHTPRFSSPLVSREGSLRLLPRNRSALEDESENLNRTGRLGRAFRDYGARGARQRHMMLQGTGVGVRHFSLSFCSLPSLPNKNHPLQKGDKRRTALFEFCVRRVLRVFSFT